MSTLDCARPRRRTIAGAAAVAVADRARGFLRAVRAAHEARAAARHLQALNDQQLKDIGVNRSQIEWLVRGHAAPWTPRSHADD